MHQPLPREFDVTGLTYGWYAFACDLLEELHVKPGEILPNVSKQLCPVRMTLHDCLSSNMVDVRVEVVSLSYTLIDDEERYNEFLRLQIRYGSEKLCVSCGPKNARFPRVIEGYGTAVDRFARPEFTTLSR